MLNVTGRARRIHSLNVGETKEVSKVGELNEVSCRRVYQGGIATKRRQIENK